MCIRIFRKILNRHLFRTFKDKKITFIQTRTRHYVPAFQNFLTHKTWLLSNTLENYLLRLFKPQNCRYFKHTRGTLKWRLQLFVLFTDSPYINEDCWNNQRERLLRYLHGPKRYHKTYAIKYYCCEILAALALVSDRRWLFLSSNHDRKTLPHCQSSLIAGLQLFSDECCVQQLLERVHAGCQSVPSHGHGWFRKASCRAIPIAGEVRIF